MAAKQAQNEKENKWTLSTEPLPGPTKTLFS